MLERLAALHVKALVEKARNARDARDRMLTGLRDEALGEPKPARGEHNPTSALGLDLLPENDPDRRALQDALSALPPPVLREIWALVLVGRGEYALKDWELAMSEAERTDYVDPSLFLEQADLHEHLAKALYELQRL